MTAAPTSAAGRGDARWTGGFAGAVASEWTKLWSVWSSWLCLASGPVLMAIFCVYYGGIAAFNDAPAQPVGNAPTTAMVVVQFAVAALAMQMVSGEYATGSIHATLLWVPRRGRLLLAKALPAAVVSFVAGVLNGAFGVVVGWLAFAGHATFDPAEVAVELVLIGVYAALVGVFAIGVAAAVRSAAGTLTLAFTVLGGLPAGLLIAGTEPMTTLYDYVPSTGGLHLMQLHEHPYPPAIGFVVVLGWVAAAYLVGLLILRKRDA
jgi:ABC-type transport system involved in multi-copper enzyme maturation permease subunit